MNIEWWMIDGILALIVVITMIIGIARGIGDGIFRLAGTLGGIALCMFYSDRVVDYLNGTRMRTSLYNHIYELLRPGFEQHAAETADESGNAVSQLLGFGTDPYAESLPKTLGSLVTDLADEATSAASERLTNIAMTVMALVVIMVGIWLVTLIIRIIYKKLRNTSYLLGFVDRFLGMVLGLVRGIILACIFMAALIPVATIITPDKVPEILTAMQDTYVAKIIYDINPIMLVIRYALGA